MDQLDVERIGGLAGFGGPNLKSSGRVDGATLSPADRAAVDALFTHPPTGAANPDEFSYRLTRRAPGGPRTIEVAERHVPMAVRAVVKDQLR